MYGSRLDEVICDAMRRHGEAVPKVECLPQYAIYMHPQTWPNSSCGFGGPTEVVPHRVVVAQTVVLVSNVSGNAFVYHDFQFAYRINKPGIRFYEDLNARRLAGAAEPHAFYRDG
jgi:hypothetical protein